MNVSSMTWGVALVAATMGLPLDNQAAETPAKPAASPTVSWAKTKQELNYNIQQINSILATPALHQVGMDNLARQTGVAAETIEATRRKGALSYGDLATGLILAKSAGVTFEQIKADRRTRSWADVAILRKVNVLEVNQKLKAIQTAVDQFIDKQAEDDAKRAMAEERRMMRQQGIPLPPPPAEPPAKRER
jgi:hypothetical protein